MKVLWLTQSTFAHSISCLTGPQQHNNSRIWHLLKRLYFPGCGMLTALSLCWPLYPAPSLSMTFAGVTTVLPCLGLSATTGKRDEVELWYIFESAMCSVQLQLLFVESNCQSISCQDFRISLMFLSYHFGNYHWLLRHCHSFNTLSAHKIVRNIWIPAELETVSVRRLQNCNIFTVYLVPHSYRRFSNGNTDKHKDKSTLWLFLSPLLAFFFSFYQY